MHNFVNVYKLLIIVTAIFSFLLPGKFFIWSELHQSSMALLSISIAGFIFLLKKEIKYDFYLFFCIFLISCIWIYQYIHALPFISYAITGTIYLSFSFLAYTLGKNINQKIVIEISSIVLIIVCLLSFLIQIYQITGWSSDYGLLIDHIEITKETRAFANIGQPNRLGVIYIFCLAILLWAFNEKLVGLNFILIVTTIIAAGISLTASRTAYLCIIVMCVFSFFEKSRTPKYYFLFLFLLCLLFSEFFEYQSDLSRDLTQSGDSGRFAIWKMSLDALSKSPWTGYGFNETGRAHFEVIETSNFQNVFTAQAHNVFIDFILWFGLPLGGIFTLIILFITFKICIEAIKKRNLFPLLALIPFSIHSLLEYPLHYANALLFFSVYLGVASNHLTSIKLLKNSFISRKHYSIAYYLLLLFSSYFFYECIKLEKDTLNQKMYFSRIYGIEKISAEGVYLADIPRSYVKSIGIRNNEKPDKKDIEDIENLLHYRVIPRHYWILLEYYKNDHKEKYNFWLQKGLFLLPRQHSDELKKHYPSQK